MPATNVIQVISDPRDTAEVTSCNQPLVDIIDPILQKLPEDVTPNQREGIVKFL